MTARKAGWRNAWLTAPSARKAATTAVGSCFSRNSRSE
jgi:hypothetical protein